MITDPQFSEDIQDIKKSFSGWDFSFVTGTGRMQEGLLTWSYGSMARRLVRQANALLDMGTGGGELLSMLRPFPKKIWATEGYEPNVSIAKKRLEPLGVRVITFEEDAHLPVENRQFDFK